MVSSPSLAVGIWRDPQTTAATFVNDGDRRWWRSRDLGRIDAGGYLYLEGRHDDMIISGGINVMPARVEEVLLAHKGVAECAVVGVPDAEWGERVQAFIVRGDPALDEVALELHVRASDLSPYQRPRVYSFVAELPRTSTNKVLRRVLAKRRYAHSDIRDRNRSSHRKKMSEPEPLLLIERQGPIAIVTLNRPDKRNALSEKLWGELKKTFENFEPDVRCVVLAGAGSISVPASTFPNIATAKPLRASSCRASPRHPRCHPVRRPAGGDRDAGRGDRRRPRGRHRNACSRRRYHRVLSIARKAAAAFMSAAAPVSVSPSLIGSGRMVEMMLTGRTLDAAAGETARPVALSGRARQGAGEGRSNSPTPSPRTHRSPIT